MIRFKLAPTWVKGPVQMLGSSLLFAIMAYFVKKATMAGVPGAEVALIRFSFGLLTAICLGATGRINLRSSRKLLLVARGVFGGGAIILYFLALQNGTVTHGTILNNTYPIFAAVVAAVLLKEKMKWSVGLCLVTTWIGLGMLIHPEPGLFRFSDFLALCSGILGGIAVTIVRQLRRDGESAWSIFFYLSLFGWLASLMIALKDWVAPEPFAWVYMLLAAGLGMVAQVMMTSAYKYCQTAVGGILSMTTMVFSTFFGLTFLGERLLRIEAVGAVVVVLGSAWAVYEANRGGVS